MDNKQALDQITRIRRRELTEVVAREFGSTVQSGPFSGTTVVSRNNWGDGDVAPKLLGVYEQELHGSLETMIASAPDVVVNVGCAEGFYAVGMAKRLPDSRVVAIDIDQTTLNIAGENAVTNGVDNVELGEACTPENLEYLLSSSSLGAVISDCEGYEMELLDPVKVPSLEKAYVLVECHDMITSGITDALYDRFSKSHDITAIKQGARDPYQFEFLSKFSDFDKWALMNEMRGETMHWLFMEPKK